MGMTDAFDKTMADFGDMSSPDMNLFVSKIIHKARIQVDESGKNRTNIFITILPIFYIFIKPR
jgi:serine protease inhibitor